MVWVEPNTIRPATTRKMQPAARLRFFSSLRSSTGSLRVSSQATRAIRLTPAMIAETVMKPEWNQSSRWPRSSVTSRKPSPSATSSMPTPSNRTPLARSCLRSFTTASGSSTRKVTSTSDRSPTGRLIRNTQCQEKSSVITPPRLGPRIGPTITTTP